MSELVHKGEMLDAAVRDYMSKLGKKSFEKRLNGRTPSELMSEVRRKGIKRGVDNRKKR